MPRRTARPAVVEQSAPPAAGHNSQHTDEQLIAENHQIEALVKQAKEKLAAWMKPYNERLKEIENDLFARLVERGASNTKTDAGTAYISTLMNPKVEDTAKLFDFLAEHWDEYGADVSLNLKQAGVERFMESNNGLVPPGMSISHFRRLNVNRS